MSWRNHKTHREETKAVKGALKAAGLPVARVSHDTGTAWGWLTISIDYPDKMTSAERYRLRDAALEIAQRVTGRRGDYGGEISIA